MKETSITEWTAWHYTSSIISSLSVVKAVNQSFCGHLHQIYLAIDTFDDFIFFPDNFGSLLEEATNVEAEIVSGMMISSDWRDFSKDKTLYLEADVISAGLVTIAAFALEGKALMPSKARNIGATSQRS